MKGVHINMKELKKSVDTLYMCDRPVLSECIRKMQEGNLSLEDLTKEKLQALWCDEMVQDSEIAYIFGTTEKAVRERRYTLGVTRLAYLSQYIDSMFNTLGIGYSIMTV